MATPTSLWGTVRKAYDEWNAIYIVVKPLGAEEEYWARSARQHEE
jgi:hypothetical protein